MCNTRFIDLPEHRKLLEKATNILRDDQRVKGLYLSGSIETDKHSDIDLMILSSREDRESLKEDKLIIAKQVGKIKAEALSINPYTYVVIYEPHGIKLDYSFHLVDENPRPDKVYIENLYDPDGIIEQLKQESSKLDWVIDINELEERAKHFFVVLTYFASKIERGELWEARDTIEFYRGYLTKFEHILNHRKPVGYRRIEHTLTPDRLHLLTETIPRSLEPSEIVRSMDSVLNYFERYLYPALEELDIYPTEYAENMLKTYQNTRNKFT